MHLIYAHTLLTAREGILDLWICIMCSMVNLRISNVVLHFLTYNTFAYHLIS